MSNRTRENVYLPMFFNITSDSSEHVHMCFLFVVRIMICAMRTTLNNSIKRKVTVGPISFPLEYLSSLNLEIHISPLEAVISSSFSLDSYYLIRDKTVRVQTHPIRNGTSNLFRSESEQHYVDVKQNLILPSSERRFFRSPSI